jgi:hypothetical protein
MRLDEAVRMVLQTLLLRRNFPCPHFFGLGEGPESDPLLPFKIGRLNGREAPECGLRLKA